MYESDSSDSMCSSLAPDDAPNDDSPSQQSDLSVDQTTKDDLGCPESHAESSPPKKKYSHFRKRRRSITDELFRCTFVTKVVSDELACGALLWKGKPQELREHLLLHLPLDTVSAMSDQQVVDTYTQAKSSILAPMPDDSVHGITPEDLDEDSTDDVEGETTDE